MIADHMLLKSIRITQRGVAVLNMDVYEGRACCCISFLLAAFIAFVRSEPRGAGWPEEETKACIAVLQVWIDVYCAMLVCGVLVCRYVVWAGMVMCVCWGVMWCGVLYA